MTVVVVVVVVVVDGRMEQKRQHPSPPSKQARGQASRQAGK